MKVEKFEYGEIHYRLPTIPDALALLAKMGMGNEGIKAEDQNELLLTSRVIANMGPMVTKVECKINGKAVQDFEALCIHFEAMNVLVKIARDIMSEITSALVSKKK